MMQSVESYLSGLDEETRQMIEEMRSIITAVAHGLVEGIKWNAPSYALNGKDRITLGVERSGGVRLVLHRGPKKETDNGFSFTDSGAIANWPSPDRGVARFESLLEIRAKRAEIEDLCVRWIIHCG